MDPGLLIPVRLSKEGYGTPEQIENMRTDLVLAALAFSDFTADYISTASELNKQK